MRPDPRSVSVGPGGDARPSSSGLRAGQARTAKVRMGLVSDSEVVSEVDDEAGEDEDELG